MFTLEDLDKAIRRVPDFPKPGILFYDITSLLTNTAAFKFCVEKMVELYKDKKIDAIAAIESRGFLFAGPVAEKLGLPIVLIRKKGKLPGETYSCSYSLEYGTAEVEVHKADLKSGANYLLIDDLIATGGTFNAAKNLVEQGGGNAVACFGVIGLPDLKFREALAPMDVTTLIDYHGV